MLDDRDGPSPTQAEESQMEQRTLIVHVHVPPWRRLVIGGLVALALGVPTAALASHVFVDVPTGSTFHTNIANIAIAGITKGCGDALHYCPADPVRRDQMAAFLNRGLGRAAMGADAGVPFDGGFVEAVGVDLTTPGAGYVQVVARGMVYTSGGGCPCIVRIQILADGTTNSYYFDVTQAANGFSQIGNTWLFPVGVGNHHFAAMVRRSFGAGGFGADTVITATWIPFDGTGGANEAAATLTVPAQEP